MDFFFCSYYDLSFKYFPEWNFSICGRQWVQTQNFEMFVLDMSEPAPLMIILRQERLFQLG